MPIGLIQGTALSSAWVLTRPPFTPSTLQDRRMKSVPIHGPMRTRLIPQAHATEIEPSSRKRWPNFLAKVMHAPTPNALKSMISDDSVNITQSKLWIVFEPTQPTDKGLIFYPGAFVDGRAYANLARCLAQQGYQVVIIKMPMSFSLLTPNRAGRAITDFPHIKNWVVGGHSLGGLTAAQYAQQHPGKIQGLVCYGSFPAIDMSKGTMKTAVILGSKDTLVKQWDFMNFERLLPETAQVHIIEGGNHSNFGDYGLQWGDQVADISFDEQQHLIVENTTNFLKSILPD